MRFYFDISDRLPIRDQVGRDFRLVSEAVVYAKYLAADLRVPGTRYQAPAIADSEVQSSAARRPDAEIEPS